MDGYTELALILLGYFICMVSDIFFSISNFFVQRAFYWREQRKKLNKGGNNE